MAMQRKYRLNLRNYGNLPAIMVSQYDTGYALVFEVYDGPSPSATLAAYTVKLIGTRADNLGYEFTGTVGGTANNVLSFTIDNTISAVAGRGTAEIQIIDSQNDILFASFNMSVFVEKAAKPNSVIDADVEAEQTLAEQIEAMVDEATGAVTQANDAKDAAETAQGKAEDAQEAAETAQGKAEDAQEAAETAEDSAETNALKAEGYAVGKQNGTDVASGSDYYQNNAKYYKEQAASSATSASGSATAAAGSATAAASHTAPTYSSSATYAVGDYCVYNSQLYRCTTAITTAEAWTAAHWTAVTVGGEISSLKEDLNATSAELLDIRVGAGGITYASAGDAVRGQINGLNEGLRNTISVNLVGTEAGVLYPCFIPKGTPYVNVSTSDGSTFLPPVGSVLKLLVYDKNKQVIDSGWVLGDTRTYLDCNFSAYYSNIDIYYVSLNVQNAVPLMVTTQKAKVNGNVPYVPYFSSTKALAEKVDEISDELNGAIPSYYQSHMESKASTLLALDNVDTQVGFITDEHYPMNAKNSPDLMRYLWNNVPMDFVVNNGDVLVQETTKAGAMQAITKFNALYDFCGDNYFPVIGNHEHNNANGQSVSTQLSLAQVKLSVLSKIRDVQFSGYTAYYFDDDVAMCRYYFIGTMQNSYPYDEDIAWTLESFKSIPIGYKVIVFSHAGLKYDSNYAVTGVQTGISSIAMGLLAVANKSSYTNNHVLYDYSSVDAVPVAIFSGHVHFDGNYQYSNANYNGYIYVISTTCDAYDTQVVGSVDRTAGTVNEQAFDVISVDYSNRLITMTRIGAGANRTFTYSDYA